MVLLIVMVQCIWHEPSFPKPAVPSKSQSPDFGNLPLSFEPNDGQTDAAVRFQAHVPGGALFFAGNEVVLSLAAPDTKATATKSKAKPASQLSKPSRMLEHPFSFASTGGSGIGPLERPMAQTETSQPPQVVRMHFISANLTPNITGSERLPGIVNYFIGTDPGKWRANLPTYGSITYSNLYPGIDLQYGGTGKLLKGTYIVAPGADPNIIRWKYEGVGDVSMDAEGNLQIPLHGGDTGTLIEQAPVAWQEIDGRRVAVEASYKLAADASIGVHLGNHDPTQVLILDPAIAYSTYLGGSSGEDYRDRVDIAVDGQGNAYVTGFTTSTDFPTQNPFQPTRNGDSDSDIFVSKFNSTGSALLYSTYLGGTRSEFGGSIAVDGLNNAYVTGYTQSDNFPTQNPFQPHRRGFQDVFVSKFNSTGSALLYSTYLGGIESGRDGDLAFSIAVDGQGNAYVTGVTPSDGFPVQNPFQPTRRGSEDAFVSKFNSTGSALLYSTYLGGTGLQIGSGIAVDGQGNAYVIGFTDAPDFPMQNPFQPNMRGNGDAFVSKFNSTGDALVYSTYLGGSDFELGSVGYGFGIAVDGQGNAYVTGLTASTDFPVQNPFQPTRHGSGDAFVSKFNSTGDALVYSTYLGGSDNDSQYGQYGDGGTGIAVDGQGNAYVTGLTSSNDFPVQNPFQPTKHGVRDVFVSKFNSTGSALLYSTYLGGSEFQTGSGIAVDGQGNAYVTGPTASTDFPVQNPFQSIFGGGDRDVFVTKIDSFAPTPLTPVPAPISDGGAPKVDGAITVWDHNHPFASNGDIAAKDLATNRTFTITNDLIDQRHPSVSGNLIVWQQRSSAGDWDIYAAQITGTGTLISSPTPIDVEPGDQVNPSVSHNLVVWQSSQQLLGTATPESATRWDIVGKDLSAPTSLPFTLTTNTNTSLNPSLDVYYITETNFVSVAVWQSTAPTMTLSVSLGSGPSTPTPGGTPTPNTTPWRIMGATNINRTPTPFTVPYGHGEQTNPSVSG